MVTKARATCRDCDAPVRWAKSEKSEKWMILDRDPVPGGNIFLKNGSGHADGIDRAMVHGRGFRSGTTVPESIPAASLQLDFDGNEKPLAYVDHHATCPYAERWRR